MQISKLREAQLKQLTGCSYPVIVYLEKLLSASLSVKRLGAPLKHPIRTMLVATLIKLRCGNAYRTLAVYLSIPCVTLNRYVKKVCSSLATTHLNTNQPRKYLIVDGTCLRIRSSNQSVYSGYKHHKNFKVQVIVDDSGRIVAVSKGYNGAIHDKTIWNKEYATLVYLFDVPILADKSYAGGKGENTRLFRPVKRNETAYKTDKVACKAANRGPPKKRVKVDHVFAQLKSFRILRDTFSHDSKLFSVFFKTVALIYNLKLELKACA